MEYISSNKHFQALRVVGYSRPSLFTLKQTALWQPCQAVQFESPSGIIPSKHISLSKLIQQWNVVALKQRVLFNIKTTSA